MTNSQLGLQRGIVRLEPYNPEWRELFEVEKSALQKVLKLAGFEGKIL